LSKWEQKGLQMQIITINFKTKGTYRKQHTNYGVITVSELQN